MPLFRYRCTECNYEFEAVVNAGDDITRCPNCGYRVRRLYSRFASRYKGDGFFSTDYKTKKNSDSKKNA